LPTEHHFSALRSGARLHTYTIDAVLGAGGFGITYRAVEDITGRAVAIKEYLPAAFAVRDRDGATVRPLSGGTAEDFTWGLQRFREEARLLIDFRHPNIVPVLAYFEAHGTGYLVMELQAGASLGDILEKRGILPEAETKAILLPLLDGVEYVHAREVLHRDIKPDNIFVRGDGSPVLLDFGAARQALGEHSRKLTTLLTEGYAPFEQYAGSGNQGPWSDIHGLAAVMFRCIVGKPPTPAPQRAAARLANLPDPIAPDLSELRNRCSADYAEAIAAGLAVVETERPRSIAEFRKRLKLPAGTATPPPTLSAPAARPATHAAAPVSSPTLVPDAALRAGPSFAVPATEPRRRRRAVAVAAGLAALIAAGATVYVADNRSWLPEAAKRAGTEPIAPAQAGPPAQAAPAPPKQPDADSLRGLAEHQQRQLEQAEAERRAIEQARTAEAERKRREDEAAKEAERKRADEDRARTDADRRNWEAREAEERRRVEAERRRAEESPPPRATPAAPPSNAAMPRRSPGTAPPGNWPPEMPDPRRDTRRAAPERTPNDGPVDEGARARRIPRPPTLDRPNLPDPDEY